MNKKVSASIIGLLIAVVLVSVWLIIDKPARLGLDLKGGVELVYEGKPTPQSPQVTSEDIDDAISVMRKRTDALGVSEPSIQKSGKNQILVSLPDVKDPETAIRQVGSTAQLYFYDWQDKIVGDPNTPIANLYQAVEKASKAKPTAEKNDLPPGGASEEVKKRFGNDEKRILEYYDTKNDTVGARYYLFDKDKKALVEGAASCSDLVSDWQSKALVGQKLAGGKTAGPCQKEIQSLKGSDRIPEGAKVLVIPQGITIVKEQSAAASTNVRPRYFVLEDDAELSGRDIKKPQEELDSVNGQPVVTFQLTDYGKKAFQRVTKRLADRGRETVLAPGTPVESSFQQFAIVLDGEVVSLATIDWQDLPNGISGGTGAQISGLGSLQNAKDLATQLRIGALPIELKLVSRTQVSATLGEEALKQSTVAFLVGFALMAIFLISFYRIWGVIAVLGLAAYAVLFFALVKLIPITLTLPGIAGLVLTLGVAADANIVSFERIKEELRKGVVPHKAVLNGYSKALKTILDANVVTIGVAFVLFMLATAGVKGFAFTLGLGTLTSLATALLGVGAVLSLTAKNKWIQKSGKPRKERFLNFMGASKIMFSISGVIILIGAIAISTLGIKLGIDFSSGTRIQYPSVVNVEQTEGILKSLNIKGEVQNTSAGKEKLVQVTLPSLQPDQINRFKDTVQQKANIPDTSFETESIGPTFGAQVARSAIVAIIVSLLLISLYIWHRFGRRYALPVLIALSHDILITAGVYALLGREINAATIAALLTILGYSLYDTIIVFDRIRENMQKMSKATVKQIVNRSMSEVLVRSLVTSLSTVLPVIALMIFGGETLQDFALAILVGVLSGAYSSIFIASPLVGMVLERIPGMHRRMTIQKQALGHEPAYYVAEEVDPKIREWEKHNQPVSVQKREEEKNQPIPIRKLEEIIHNNTREEIPDESFLSEKEMPSEYDQNLFSEQAETTEEEPSSSQPKPKMNKPKKKPSTNRKNKKRHGRK